ncbi:MAG: RAD55 family ATPase [Candidatus Aenigmatarchaeota archaeon]
MPRNLERVSTGIPGLDDLIEGGFVKDNAVLVTGSAGTGKTIFCSQFIWEGLQNGENCMFITFEERPEKIKDSASDFGWDFEKYEENGQLVLRQKDPFEAAEGDELFWFRSELEKQDVDRLAMDSTSILSLYYDDQYKVRENLFKIVRTIEEADTTAVLTTEAPEGEDKLTRFGVEEYLVDGVIELNFSLVGTDSGRSLAVRKMRRTNFEEEKFPMEIDDKGISVLSI